MKDKHPYKPLDHSTIKFPNNFIFGTSTSAYQIETADDHDWLNIRSRDGNTFSRTTDHEKKLAEDVEIIASLAPHYRMSLMWSKIQRSAFAPLDQVSVRHYTELFQALTERGVKIMMVMHHFANPTWFAENGGWENPENIAAWVDYGRQLVHTFGKYVSFWNTFNEPNLYTAMAYVLGEFPPFKKNVFKAKRVVTNLAQAHDQIYDFIKENDPGKMVGISHNCTFLAPENFLGTIPAKVSDWLYMVYTADLFQRTDFFGMSYYARIGFDPFPLTYLTSPDKIRSAKKAHDDMWEYYPEGLEACVMRFWEKYNKPIFITENGICTQDDTKRVQAIKDYMDSLSNALKKGADVRAYYHWSTWDNFEWSLGPTYHFGLYACDPVTKERKKKPSADLYATLAFTKVIQTTGHH